VGPTARGSSHSTPKSPVRPILWKVAPSLAFVAAIRTSHARASDSPAPTAAPSIMAITGLGSARKARTASVSASRFARRTCRGSASRSGIVFRSPPAQKVPPAPYSTATAWSGSLSKARNASASACAVGPSTALRACGRSITIVVTGPSRNV
jgi:hypothetical protein